MTENDGHTLKHVTCTAQYQHTVLWLRNALLFLNTFQVVQNETRRKHFEYV
jgi:hypothetical protein